MKRRTQFFLQANGKVVADEMVTLRKSQVDKLIAEVNALRADKARLDWIIGHSTLRFFAVLSEDYVKAREQIDTASARKEAQP